MATVLQTRRKSQTTRAQGYNAVTVLHSNESQRMHSHVACTQAPSNTPWPDLKSFGRFLRSVRLLFDFFVVVGFLHKTLFYVLLLKRFR